MHLLSLVIAGLTTALSPLEQPDGSGIYLGAWYDRLGGDTPSAINDRVNYKPMSFFQADFNITDTLQSTDIAQFIKHIEDTKTDAFVYLTLYPYKGFDAVNPKALDEFCAIVKSITDKGRKVLIRYASEMNGVWFAYGQKPKDFKKYYIDLVTKVRNAAGKDMTAFLWAPNSGNGYPFPKTSADITDFESEMDTNGDGILSDLDDPYSPFYPGDDYVDWVGFSIYHYGKDWREFRHWMTNDIPADNKVYNILHGLPDPVMGDIAGFRNRFSFYDMFCKVGLNPNYTVGGKPFFIAETAATLHLTRVPNTSPNNDTFIDGPEEEPPNKDPDFRAAMKQAWWRQILNQTFLEMHPKIKGMAFFEFIKFEEKSLRDFTTLGKGTDKQSKFGRDGGDMDGPTLAAFQDDIKGDIGKLIYWGKQIGPRNNDLIHSVNLSLLIASLCLALYI